MEAERSESRTARSSRNSRNRRWYLILPVIALVFQIVPPLLIWVIANASYTEPRSLSQAWEDTVTPMALGMFAGAGILLGSFGAYGLLTRANPRTAVLMILFCCFPALLGGALYLHALLIFLTLI
jgi:hypothetical protein